MIESLMNNELEGLWEEAVVARFKVLLSQHFSGETEENIENTSLRIAGARAEIWNQELLNTKQECERIGRNVRQETS
jgi:hypothetical protein